MWTTPTRSFCFIIKSDFITLFVEQKKKISRRFFPRRARRMFCFPFYPLRHETELQESGTIAIFIIASAVRRERTFQPSSSCCALPLLCPWFYDDDWNLTREPVHELSSSIILQHILQSSGVEIWPISLHRHHYLFLYVIQLLWLLLQTRNNIKQMP